MQDPADPQSLNRYSYVRNNPVNFVDPSGYRKKKHHNFFRRIIAVVAAIVVAAVVIIAQGGPENPWADVAGIATAIATYQAIAGTGGRGSAPAPSSSIQETGSPRGPPGEAGDLLAVGGAAGGALRVAEGAAQAGGGGFSPFAQSEAYHNLLLMGVAPTAALLSISTATQENLWAMGQAAGEVVSALPAGSGTIFRSLAFAALTDSNSPTALLRLKLTQELQVQLGFVKLVRNNRFLFPGSQAFGTPAKSFAFPVFKTVGRALGAMGLATDMYAAGRAFGSGDVLEGIRQSGFAGIDGIGLIGSAFFPWLRLVPPAARAIDLAVQEFSN